MGDGLYGRTLPQPTELDGPYWDGLRRYELLIQRCTDCQSYLWYPTEVCSRCQSFSMQWTPVAPTGEIYSFTTQYQRTGSKFDEDIPYTSVIVQLAEASEVTMGGLLVEADPDQVRVGLPVVGVFVDATPEITLLQFRPQT